MGMKIRLYPDWGPRVLREQPVGGKYERYARSVGHDLIRAAKLVYITFNKKGNEAEISELTPPKYLASFKLTYFRTTFTERVSNTDPGWHLVEWGAHPGGGHTRVLRYKPLTRSLLIVGAKFKGR